MARKSNNLDKKIIRAGAIILKRNGAAALSIREVAKRADVNLGMFNYYFDGKDEFIRTILVEVYSPFIVELKNSHTQSLEEILFSMATFSRDHQQLILPLINDVLSGEPNVTRFLQKNFTIHFKILLKALSKYFKGKGYNPKNKEHAFRYLISTIGLPNLLVGIQNRVRPAREHKREPDSDESLRRRVQAAISGLEFICKD